MRNEKGQELNRGNELVIDAEPRVDLHPLIVNHPMKVTSLSEFTFKPEGGRTLVTWTMSGKNGFIAKAFGLFMDYEKMVGGQFETGLAQLEMAAKAVPRK